MSISPTYWCNCVKYARSIIQFRSPEHHQDLLQTTARKEIAMMNICGTKPHKSMQGKMSVSPIHASVP